MKAGSRQIVGIKDVAKAAGVSPATVSRALGRGPVSAELRERVQTVARAIGYRPNLSARRLRSQETRTIGLIVADVRNPFFTAVSRAVEDIAYAQGMRLVLCNTDENPEREAFYIRAMQEERVTGLILAPSRTTLKAMENGFSIDVPTVLIDRATPDCGHDAVMTDNLDAAAALTEHMAAQGFRKIAGLFGASSTTGAEREAGFRSALAERALPATSRFVAPNAAAAEAAFKTLWTEDRPDAVVVSNSLLALGVLRAVDDLGLTIPADIGVAAFDDEPWTSLVRPAITVIAQPVDEIGKVAMRLLSDRIDHGASKDIQTVLLPGLLIARGSTSGG